MIEFDSQEVQGVLDGRWWRSFLLSNLIGASLADRIVVYLHLADVAELADAQASGACALRGVEVRLLSSALSLLWWGLRGGG